MARIYTRGGDGGETSLFGGERVRKNHPRVRAYGEVDELGSAVGVAIAGLDPSWDIARTLRSVQHQLFRVGGALADPAGKTKIAPPEAAEAAALEQAIDLLEEQLPELKRFVLPGGTMVGGHLHLARAICRRAERSVVDLAERGESVSEGIIVYLNRLSDYLFVAARAVNRRAGAEEEPWDPER
jgi:cob(I)alamin adenosyltransferase